MRWIGTLVCALLLAGCAGSTLPTPRSSIAASPGSDGPAAIVRVTLDLYSGRPDPTWVLTDAEATRLEGALAALPGATGAPPVGGLGYHGFTIERTAGTLIAYGGTVAPPGEGPRAFLADPARSVERLLAETARAHVTSGEATEVARALGAP